MSRAINLNTPVKAVTELCEKLSIGISSIEPLDSGGTRVVLNNSTDAETIRRRMKDKVIDGLVTRSPLYAGRAMAPFS